MSEISSKEVVCGSCHEESKICKCLKAVIDFGQRSSNYSKGVDVLSDKIEDNTENSDEIEDNTLKGIESKHNNPEEEIILPIIDNMEEEEDIVLPTQEEKLKESVIGKDVIEEDQLIDDTESNLIDKYMKILKDRENHILFLRIQTWPGYLLRSQMYNYLLMRI